MPSQRPYHVGNTCKFLVLGDYGLGHFFCSCLPDWYHFDLAFMGIRQRKSLAVFFMETKKV